MPTVCKGSFLRNRISNTRGRVACESLFTAGLVVLVYSLQAAINGVFPFGGRSNQVNDLGGQFTPFAGMFRDIVAGYSGLSSLTFTWTMGMGVPNLGNYATYFSNPFFLLVCLFPENHMQLAIWVVTVVLLAFAAVTMLLLLRKLFPAGNSVMVILLAASYALGSWAIGEGDYVPMWISGLAGLPLLVLVGIWAIENRHFWLSVITVFLVVWSNYYTAVMAIMGAALIFFAVLYTKKLPVKDAVLAAARFLLRGAIGSGMTAVLLIPTYLQVKQVPADGGAGFHDAPISVMFANLYGFVEGLAKIPSFSVGAVALVFAILFLFQKKYSLSDRVTWGVLLTATIASMSFSPTVMVWNLFDAPNGSPWRCGFVVSAMIVIMAWHGVQHMESTGIFGLFSTAIICVALMSVTYHARTGNDLRAWSGMGLKLSLALALLVILLSLLFSTRAKPVAVCVIVIGAVIQITVQAAWLNENKYLSFGVLPNHLAEAFPADMEAFRANNRWPDFRADVLDIDNYVMANGGAIMSAPTANYNSSLMPSDTSDLLQNQLAFTGALRPRIAAPIEHDLVAQGIASVRYYYRPNQEKTFSAFPMVREMPKKVDSDPGLPEVFRNRNDVIGDAVYSPASDLSIERVSKETGDSKEYTLAFSCPQRLYATLDFRKYQGDTDLKANSFQVQQPSTELLNKASSGSLQTIRLRPATSEKLEIPVACTDLGRFKKNAEEHKIPAIQASPGRISARFNKPVDSVLVATTAFANWKCSVDGEKITHSSVHGLLAVPMKGGTGFECNYHTSGLIPGAAISMFSLLVFAILGISKHRREISTRSRKQ